MNANRRALSVSLGTLLLLTSAPLLQADANPYQTIWERNAFGLKPPPPPPTNEPPPAQTAPLAKVILTGITSMFKEPRALLEITEQEPGKPGTTKKPILREGEREGVVEVVSIDVDKSMVRILNSGIETNLTFEVKASSGPAAPGPAGVPNPAMLRPPLTTALGANPGVPASGGNAPIIISRDGSGGSSSGVTLVGGAASPATAGVAPVAAATTVGSAPASGVTSLGASPGRIFSSTPTTTLGSPTAPAPGSESGLRVIPARTVRTSQADQQVINVLKQYQGMHEQKEAFNRAGLAYPPMPPLPGLTDDTHAPNAPPGPPGLPPMPQ